MSVTVLWCLCINFCVSATFFWEWGGGAHRIKSFSESDPGFKNPLPQTRALAGPLIPSLPRTQEHPHPFPPPNSLPSLSPLVQTSPRQQHFPGSSGVPTSLRCPLRTSLACSSLQNSPPEPLPHWAPRHPVPPEMAARAAGARFTLRSPRGPAEVGGPAAHFQEILILQCSAHPPPNLKPQFLPQPSL